MAWYISVGWSQQHGGKLTARNRRLIAGKPEAIHMGV
jgi:hypothetical protein